MTLDEPGEGGLRGYDVVGEDVMREVGICETGLKKRMEMKAIRLDMRLYRGAHCEPYTHCWMVSPIFGKSCTASACKMYGHWEAHFGDQRYGNGSHTNWAVHPSFMVWRAALHSSPPAHLHSLIMFIKELLDFGLGNPIMPSTSKEEGVNLSQNTGSKSFYLTYFQPFILHTG